MLPYEKLQELMKKTRRKNIHVQIRAWVNLEQISKMKI